jgi:parallel beta-helix repeat protein
MMSDQKTTKRIRWDLRGHFSRCKAFGIFAICLLRCTLPASNATGPTLPPNCSGDEIQLALDRMPNGGEVVLGPGRYVVSHPIILRHDRQTLRGCGADTVLFLADNANCPVVVLGAACRRPMRTTSQLRLADLAIDGNRFHQQSEGWQPAVDGSLLNNNGIDIWNATDVIVQRVSCCHCRSGGLVSASGARRLTVDDFTAYDNQFDGLACYLTEDSRFNKLFLHDNLAAGISLDLSFNHNLITDAKLIGNDLGIFMRNSRDNRFEDLTIRNSRRYGVFMAQALDGSKGGHLRVNGTECVGNRFDKVSIRDCGVEDFLINDASCTNNVICRAPEPAAPVVRAPALAALAQP